MPPSWPGAGPPRGAAHGAWAALPGAARRLPARLCVGDQAGGARHMGGHGGSARLGCPALPAGRSGAERRDAGAAAAARLGSAGSALGGAGPSGGAGPPGGGGVAASWGRSRGAHTPTPPPHLLRRGRAASGRACQGRAARPGPAPPPPPPARSHPPFRAASAAAPPRTLSPRPCRRGRVRPPAPRPGAGSPTPTGVTQRGDVRRRAPPGRERGRWLSINLTLLDSDRGETGRAGASFTGSPRGLNISLFFLPQKKTRGVIVCLITQLPIPETKWPYRLNRILLRILKTGYRTGAGTCAETLPRPRSPRALTCEDRQRGTKLTEALARHRLI